MAFGMDGIGAGEAGRTRRGIEGLLAEQQRTNALLHEQNALLLAMLGTLRDASPGPHDVTTAERDDALVRARTLAGGAAPASGHEAPTGRGEKRRRDLGSFGKFR